MARQAALLLLAVTCALAAAAPGAVAQTAPVEVPAGEGATLRIEPSPFRIALVEADGRESVATVPGREGAPVRPPGLDGPQPVEPLGALGGFPAMGFVVGANPAVTYPLPFFTGNRLFGAEAGGIVSVTGITGSEPTADGVRVALSTDAPGLGPASLLVQTRAGGGVKLDLRPPPDLPGIVSTVFTLGSPTDEGLYGLGARKDSFDQRGRLRNVWTEEQNAADQRTDPVTAADPTGTTGPDYTFPNGAQAAYFVQAALHGSRGWSAWVDQTELSRLDLAASRPDAIRWGVAAQRLTLSLAGGGLERSAQAYSAAVGRAPAPPTYVYEPWIDVINEGEGEAAPNGSGFSGGARVRAELEEIARKARELDLPVGTLGVEGWHRVPGGAELFARLRREGFRLSAYWNPFTSPDTPAFREARELDVLVEDPNGEPYFFVNNRGGRSAVIDFSAPGAVDFWKRQIDRSSDLGFEAFMHDFGEFVTEGMRFHNGNTPEVEHNAYPVRFHRAARAALDEDARERPGFEPFFYVRSGFNGATASTSAVFPGDETTDFAEGSGLPSVPPAMLNMAMGGGYTFTTDVGGYLDLVAPRTSPELFIRWTQLASFTAVNRIHNSTFRKSVYPWELGDEALGVYRRYAKAKVKLIGLVDGWSRRAARDGTIGPVRPLVLDDPSPAARSIDDEWLLGDDLLVAPVLREGARRREVYLPAGARWQRVRVGAGGELVDQGAPEDGGRTITAEAPLADIPLFRRVTAAAAAPGAASRETAAPRRRQPARNERSTAREEREERATGDAPQATVRAPAGGGGGGGGDLPFTGLSLAILVAAGTALLGAGVALRRRTRRG